MVLPDNAFGVRIEADSYFSPGKFEFKIVYSPTELHQMVKEKNQANKKSRVVAGYCWEWLSRNDRSLPDIEYPKFGFEADWNLAEYGNKWVIDAESVEEI